MKEKRWYISHLQLIFLDKIVEKIEGGWDRYSTATKFGIQEIIRGGYYGESQQRYLNKIREDYIKDFCTTEEEDDILPWDIV